MSRKNDDEEILTNGQKNKNQVKKNTLRNESKKGQEINSCLDLNCKWNN